MPKMKTKTAAKKRFKISAGGKLVRRKAMESHMRGKMSPKRRRALSQDHAVSGNDRLEAMRLLGLK